MDSGSTASYLYNAEGQRVQKTVAGAWRDYVYDNSGNVVAETIAAGWNVGYVYVGGQLMAQYCDSTTYFIHRDHLSSAHLVTKLDKSVYDSLDFLPFGEQVSGASGTSHKFTGDERDAETSLDHTWFRQYSASLGRWMTPDPAGLAAVNPTFPQSWNRYAYVSNSPLSFTDPFGLFCNYLTPDGEVGRQDFDIDQANCAASGGTRVPPGGNNSYLDCIPGAICIDATDKTPGPDADLAANWRPDYERHLSVAEYDDLHGRFKPTLAYTFSLVVPLYYGFGPAINISYVPSQKLLCAGGGAGASLGHSVSIGAVIVDANHTRDILGGPSFSGGYNSTFFRGAQGSINANGSTGGFSLGIPGLSASTTYSGCHNY
ncbi:MAG TPA: RHS repeat-associated core domain-containing protein [Candidatus Acidoferrum sp.]